MYRNFICRTDLYSATADRCWCHRPNRTVCATQIFPMRIRRSTLCVQISRERSYPFQYIDNTTKAFDCATTLPLTVKMKLCSRLFVLYCRCCPKDDKSRYFDPSFEGVRGGVEPWLIARWKARVEFLLRVIELFLYLLRLSRYKAKRVKTRCYQERVDHLEPKFQGEGVVPGEYVSFVQNYSRHTWLTDNANCTVLRAVVLTKYRRVTYTDWQTDRRTDGQTNGGNTIASTALAMRTLRRAIKTVKYSCLGNDSIGPSVCCVNAALCQVTLITCCYYCWFPQPIHRC